MDVSGADPERLRSQAALVALFDELVAVLQLHVIAPPQWHVFPGPAGITGLALLAESHLAVHTFPEHGFAALNVYCCRTRARPDFESLVRRYLGAGTRASVRELSRGVTP